MTDKIQDVSYAAKSQVEDWSRDPRIVVRHCNALAIWLNADGEVVIREEDPWGDEDVFVRFPAEQATRVIAKIQQLISGCTQVGGDQ